MAGVGFCRSHSNTSGGAMTRDELLEKATNATTDRGWLPVVEARGVSEVVFGVVLAAGERRWLCGRDNPGCSPELVAQYPRVHNAATGCGYRLVLPELTGGDK